MKTAFIYMGDPQCDQLHGSGTDYSRWARLLSRAYTAVTETASGRQAGRIPDDDADGSCSRPFLVFGGDLVNRSGREDEWTAFFRAGGEYFRKMRVIAPIGYHDGGTGMEHRFCLPANGPAGYEGNFYSYERENCHFIVLDTEFMGTRQPEGISFLQEWIRRDLESAGDKALFVVMHHPMFTVGTSLDDEVRAGIMRKNYLPLFEEFGVDFILCGHQHMYCRSRSEADGPVQIMGVSGTKLWDGYDLSEMACVREFIPTATVFTVEQGRIRMRTIDEEGRAVDEFERPVRKKKADGDANRSDPARHDASRRKSFQQDVPRCGSLQRDPFRPNPERGLILKAADGRETALPWETLNRLPLREMTYSVMRRGKRREEVLRGILLEDVLRLDGIEPAMQPTHTGLFMTSAEGRTFAVSLRDLMDGKSFSEEGETLAPPILVPDRDGRMGAGFRLVCGQNSPAEYNGRKWKRGILSVEVISLDVARKQFEFRMNP